MNKKIFFFFLLWANLLLIIGFWWKGSGTLLGQGMDNLALALGRLAGLLGAFYVLMQIQTIGRARWLESSLGLDRLSRLHHANGKAALVFIVAHPILLAIGYGAFTGLGFFSQILDFIRSYEDVLGAFFALLIFIGVVGMSLYIVRNRLRYEQWYIIHLSVYLAVALAFGHQLDQGHDLLQENFFRYYWYALYAFVIGNLVIYRFLRPAWLFYRHGFYVKRVEMETRDVVSIYIAGKDMDKFRILAGQFNIIRFLDKSRWWQAHPFSLSVAPNGEYLRISVKNVGDFTSQISRLAPGTKVLIDGPYGIFTDKAAAGPKFLFIAGGIGITPIRSIIERLTSQGTKDMALLYGNRTEQDTAFKEELLKLSQRGGFPVHFVMSDQPDWVGEKGRISMGLLSRLVPDFASREIYICGPPPMMKGLVSGLLEAGVPGRLVHYERFSL